jgi:hypothetical protein
MSGGHDISSYGHISDRRVAGMSVRFTTWWKAMGPALDAHRPPPLHLPLRAPVEFDNSIEGHDRRAERAITRTTRGSAPPS